MPREETPTLIPADFAQRQVELHGQAGADWLARLPALIGELADRWDIKVGPPFPDLSYNYVAPARQAGGRDVVLKLGVPGGELLCEMEALRLFGGRGCVELLRAEPAEGALLLERLRPGTMLAALDDEAATAAAAEVMQRLWCSAPAEHRFPIAADWAAGLARLREQFEGGTGPFPERLVAAAEGLFRDLLASAGPPWLLHGDLHHFNILAAQRAPWLALDPKGLVGEAAYEVGALLRNPVPEVYGWPDLERGLARRLDQLSEALSFDRQRIWGWAAAQAVLSAWWTYEDHGHGWEPGLRLAEALFRVRPK